MGLVSLTLVGVGGAVGALLRYAMGRWTAGKGKRGIYGTLAVNLTGSFGLGILIGLQMERTNPDLFLLLAAGVFGGLTTYSTLNVQKAMLAAEGARGLLAGYLAATYGGCLILTIVGFGLGHTLLAT